MEAEGTCALEQVPVARLCRRLARGVRSLVYRVAPAADRSLEMACEAAALAFLERLREKARAVPRPRRCAYCARSVQRHMWHQELRQEAAWSRHRVSFEDLRTPEGEPADLPDPATDVFDQVVQGLPWDQRLPEDVAEAIAYALDEREREMLRLYYFEEHTDRDIAARFGLKSAHAAYQVRARPGEGEQMVAGGG